MKINVVEKYNAAVIELKGDILDGPHNEEFSGTLKKLVSNEKKNIVIDLAETKYMNSSGLGMLIGGYTTVKNAGGDLKLANVTKKIESLLVITKLSTIFENYASVDEAVKSFN
jgi:anti-sigma B factor antagonist